MHKEKLTERIKIRISEPMADALKRLAAKRSSNPSQVGREALVQFLVSRGEIVLP